MTTDDATSESDGGSSFVGNPRVASDQGACCRVPAAGVWQTSHEGLR